MELAAIVLIIVFFFVICSYNKSEGRKQKHTKSYKDYDVSQRSSPHPNDTILGKAKPHESQWEIENQRKAWDKIKRILSDVTISGTYYRNLDEIFRAEDLQIGEELFLVKEPRNDFDKNALRVMTNDNYHIGYIPKNLCRIFNEALLECEYHVFVSEVRKGSNAPYIHIKVEIVD